MRRLLQQAVRVASGYSRYGITSCDIFDILDENDHTGAEGPDNAN
jgi:hypothetical protein